MTSIPVVFLENVLVAGHGDGVPNWFLQAMHQAKDYGNEVVWLGNSEGADVQLTDLVTPESTLFYSSYVHLSTNHKPFELFCMGRWFFVLEYMKRNGLQFVFHADSDVLLYCNVATEWSDHWRGYDFTLSVGTSAHASYITQGALQEFCEMISAAYRHQEGDGFYAARRVYDSMQQQRLPGGISDMYWWKQFAGRKLEEGRAVGEMTAVVGGKTFDHNINVSDGYLMNDGIKLMLWMGGQPTGVREDVQGSAANVEFNALHFQGGAKKRIFEFTVANL